MEPLYKKGDIVKIAKREGNKSDYRFQFTDEMQRFVGQSFEIADLRPSASEPCMRKDDGWVYYLRGGATGYRWASSMFEPKKKAEKKFEIVVKTKSRIKLNFNN